MPPATLSLLVLLASALTACSGSDDERTVPLPSGSASGAGVGSGGTPAGTRAVANTHAQMQALHHASCAELGVPPDCGYTSPAMPDPDDLYLRFSDLEVSCNESTVTFIGCESHWYVRLYLPLAAQQVGTYDLGTSGIHAGFQENLADDECTGILGSLAVATVELTAIEADRIDFVFDAEPLFEADPSGTYSALRCP